MSNWPDNQTSSTGDLEEELGGLSGADDTETGGSNNDGSAEDEK